MAKNKSKDGDLLTFGEVLEGVEEKPLHELEPQLSVEEDIPRIDVSGIAKLRMKLLDEFKPAWAGRTVSPAMVDDELMPIFRTHMKRCKVSALRDTLALHLYNVPLRRDTWEYICIRMSGNYDHLKIKSLTSSSALPHNQWALIRFNNAEYHRTKAGHTGGIFTAQVRTGLAAGHSFTQFLPLGFLAAFGHTLGLGKARWKRHPRLYFGMTAIAYLQAADRIEDTFFTTYHANAGCKRGNKFQAKGRTDACINGFQMQCWNCPRGKLEVDEDKSCVYATHQYEWDKRTCPRGHQGWYDVNWPTGSLCRRCRESTFIGVD